MESLGNYLRTERELRSRSVEEAAKATKVRVQFLRAIEEDVYDLLPHGLYLKGFLTAYARYLGLNPKEVSPQYHKHLEGTGVLREKPIALKRQIRCFRLSRKRSVPRLLSVPKSLTF